MIKFPFIFKSFQLSTIRKCPKYLSTLGERYDYSKTSTDNSQTLLGRLIDYLDHNKEEAPLSKSLKLLNSLDHKRKPPLLKISAKELRSCIKLSGNQSNGKLLNKLDALCCQNICDFTTQETCDVLHSFIQTISNQTTRLDFYNQAGRFLYQNVDNLTKDELVQLMFFIALKKKSYEAKMILPMCLNKLTPHLSELDSSQLCIICNSMFKASVKSNNNFLNFIGGYINRNLWLLSDPHFFITFIKLIRQNKHQTEEFLTNISCAIFFNKTSKYYSLVPICHILAMYSDYLYHDEALFDLFVNQGLQLLEQKPCNPELNHLLSPIRTKDINRFIWCLANINYQNLSKEQIKNVIVPRILDKLNDEEYVEDPEIFIDIFVNLWIMNYKPYELVPYVFDKNQLLRIQDSATPVKQRLNLLLSLIYYEDEDLYEKIGVEPLRTTTYSAETQIQKRWTLQRVLDALKMVSKTSHVNRFETTCQIPHLNIVGITGYTKKIYKSLHIEVLDEFTSVKNAEELPSGLMQAKLRIMDNMEEGLVVVDANEICDMTEFELQQHLEDSINLVT